MTLFEQAGPPGEAPPAPLAERLRPTSLAEVSGQEHLTGPDGALTRLLQAPTLGSMIFWGPPGSGKTTVARLIGAHALGRLRPGFGDPFRCRRAQEDLRRCEGPPRAGTGHAPVRGRDPPLQPGAAGFLPAGDGGRRGHADRRHHRKPVVRTERRASLESPRARLPGAHARGAGGSRRPRRAAPRQVPAGRRRGARGADRHGGRRRPRGADARRGSLARRPARTRPSTPVASSTWCSGARRSTTRGRTATTT